jgi:hypothetical protein
MKRDKIIYWTTTGIVCVVMVFSIVNFTFFDYYPYPEGAFNHLHLPAYFKTELTIAKVLGVMALLIPEIPYKIKEFAYFGFGITLVSASVAHFSVGDGFLFVMDPMIFLGVLVISYRYFQRIYSGKAMTELMR